MAGIMTKEERKAYNAAYYAKNRERHRSSSSEWQKTNPAKSSAIKKSYKNRNPEKVKESNKRESDESRGSHAARQSIRNRIIQMNTNPDVKAIYVLSAGNAILACNWCGAETQKGGRHVDHVKPLALGGSHEAKNLCIACKHCNLSKGAKDPEIFRRGIAS